MCSNLVPGINTAACSLISVALIFCNAFSLQERCFKGNLSSVSTEKMMCLITPYINAHKIFVKLQFSYPRFLKFLKKKVS